MDIYGYVWTYMDIYEYLWICMDVNWHLWTFMDMYGLILEMFGYLRPTEPRIQNLKSTESKIWFLFEFAVAGKHLK